MEWCFKYPSRFIRQIKKDGIVQASLMFQGRGFKKQNIEINNIVWIGDLKLSFLQNISARPQTRFSNKILTT